MDESWTETGAAVADLLLRFARARREGRRARPPRAVETRFACRSRLAVYGTLAPGRENHHHVADLGGRWFRGTVRGRFHESGWGLCQGFPALRWDETTGDGIPVQVLEAGGLGRRWSRLDAFEGEDYLRILVPVHLEGDRFTVANLYELRGDPPPGARS